MTTSICDSSSHFANRLLIVFAFACPWLYGWSVAPDIRVAAVDLFLIPCAVMTVLLARRAILTWPVLITAIYLLSVVASTLQWQGTDLYNPLLLKSIRMLGIFAPALLIYLMPLPSIRFDAILRAFYLGGLISVAVGMVGFVLQIDSLTAVQTYYYDRNSYLHRAGGVFRDSAAFSHLIATWSAVAFLWVSFMPNTRKLKRLAIIVSTSIVCLAGLYATLARAALLNVIVVASCLVIFLFSRNFTPQKSLFAILLAAAILVLPLVLEYGDDEDAKGLTLPVQRMASTVDSLVAGMDALDAAGGGRLTSWRKSISIWAESPLLGIGYKSLIPAHGIAADNNLVLALVETGLIGAFSLFLVGLMCTVNVCNHYLCRSFSSSVVLAMWFGQLTHSLTADIFTFMGSMPIVLIIVYFYLRLPPQFAVARMASRAGVLTGEAAGGAYPMSARVNMPAHRPHLIQ